MKKILTTVLITILFLGFGSLKAANNNEKLGLPGDNLNLYAVMDIFQYSETLEEFERKLNDSQLLINNLDLNNDNLVDYIFVNDYPSGDIHQIVLQVALGKDDLQDVAVFIVEKLKNGGVSIQLIGDEALYGPNYIVEPVYESTPNPGYIGNANNKPVAETTRVERVTYYEVASWPVIVFISRPVYVPWHSAWYWGYYPPYWAGWRPYYWDYYYGYHYSSYHYYYSHYHIYHQPRSPYYRDVYWSQRRHASPTVVVNINNNYYQNTYSRPDQRSEGESLYQRRLADNQYVPGRGQRSSAQGQQSRSGGQNAVKPGLEKSRGTIERSDSKSMSRPANGNSSAERSQQVQRSREVSKDAKSQQPINRGQSGSSGNTVKRSSGTSSDVQRPASPQQVKRAEQTSSPRIGGSTQSSSSTVKSSSQQKAVSPQRSQSSAPKQEVVRPTESKSRGSSVSTSSQQKSVSSSSGSKAVNQSTSKEKAAPATKSKSQSESKSGSNSVQKRGSAR